MLSVSGRRGMFRWGIWHLFVVMLAGACLAKWVATDGMTKLEAEVLVTSYEDVGNEPPRLNHLKYCFVDACDHRDQLVVFTVMLDHPVELVGAPEHRLESGDRIRVTYRDAQRICLPFFSPERPEVKALRSMGIPSQAVTDIAAMHFPADVDRESLF